MNYPLEKFFSATLYKNALKFHECRKRFKLQMNASHSWTQWMNAVEGLGREKCEIESNYSTMKGAVYSSMKESLSELWDLFFIQKHSDTF